MTYSPPKYPTEIPTYATDGNDMPPWYDDLDDWTAHRSNSLRLELCACLTTLGTLPQGNYTTVKDRLDNTFVGCSLGLTTDYDMANNTDVILQWYSTNSIEHYDDLNAHSFTVNPSRLSILSTGLYSILFRANFYLVNSGPSWYRLGLKKNGAVWLPFLQDEYTGEVEAFLGNSFFANLTNNDYLELYARASFDDTGKVPTGDYLFTLFKVK